MNNNKKILYNSLNFFMIYGIGFLFSLIFANLLTKEEFGILQLFLLVGTVLIISFVSLMESAASYYSAKYLTGKKSAGVVSFFVLVSILIGILLTLFVYFGNKFILGLFEIPVEYYDNSLYALQIFSLFFFVNSISTVARGILRGLNWIKERTITSVLTKIFYLGLGVIGYFVGGFVGILWGMIIAILIGDIYALFVLRKRINAKGLKSVTYQDKKDFFSYGRRVFWLNVSNQIHNWADSFLIGIFVSTTALGIYSVSYMIFDGIRRIPTILYDVFFAKLVQLDVKKKSKDFNDMALTIFRVIAIMMIGIGLVALAFSYEIIDILFQGKYPEAIFPFQLFVVLFAFSSIGTINMLFMTNGKPELNSRIAIISTVLNVGLNLVLIPMFQIIGAVIATILSRMYHHVHTLHLMKTNNIMDFSVRELNIMLLAILMMLPFYFTNDLVVKTIWVIVCLVFLYLYARFTNYLTVKQIEKVGIKSKYIRMVLK